MEDESYLQIERADYEAFVWLWDQGSFEHQRLGQAFYNHFNLHKLANQAACAVFMRRTGIKHHV